MTNIRNGIVAGMVGTLTLNVVTYVDIACSARAESDVPAESIRRLAELLGCTTLAASGEAASEPLKRRRAALGALLGFGVGIGVGALAGALRGGLATLPRPLAALGVGAAAMAAADAPIAGLGISDPRTWSTVDWLRDAVPHAAYGFAVVAVLDMLAER